jgi:hypothetical protein
MWLAQFLLVLTTMGAVAALVGILLYFARLYVLDEPVHAKVCDDVIDLAASCGGAKPCAPDADPFDEFGGSYSVLTGPNDVKRRRGG